MAKEFAISLISIRLGLVSDRFLSCSASLDSFFYICHCCIDDNINNKEGLSNLLIYLKTSQHFLTIAHLIYGYARCSTTFIINKVIFLWIDKTLNWSLGKGEESIWLKKKRRRKKIKKKRSPKRRRRRKKVCT